MAALRVKITPSHSMSLLSPPAKKKKKKEKTKKEIPKFSRQVETSVDQPQNTHCVDQRLELTTRVD